MLKLFICDPDPDFSAALLHMLQTYCQRHTVAATVSRYPSGEALLQAQGEPDIVFLETRLGDTGLSGIETAQALRARNRACELLFLTTDPSHALEGFSVQAAGYLLKPISFSQLDQVLDRCMARFWENTHYIELTCNRTQVKLPILAIRYAEVRKNQTILHTRDHAYSAYLPLEELEPMLPADAFLRCHRSYLVHLRYVDRIAGNSFLLLDGTQVPIRIREKAAVRQAYQDYLFRQAQQELWKPETPHIPAGK